MIVGFAEPEALQTGTAETAEDQETPGPDTVQLAFWPFTPVALHATATAVPVRTRFGVAVMVRFVLALVHQVASTETLGQKDTAEFEARTFMA